MDKIEIKINEKYVGKTIKEFLKSNNVGRGKIENLRVNKSTLINGQYCNLESKLNKDDVLSILIDETIDFVCDDNFLDVAYEDEYILIVNKPLNMIIHPDDKSKNNTLVNLVANYFKKNNINRKVRFINRIDKETTGLVLFAKDFFTESILLKSMLNHEIKREYLAFIEGKMKSLKGTINASIGNDRHINNKKRVCSNGDVAITDYQVIQEYKNYSLVKFSLQTGRTHQIRVHASYLSHPLLGDVLYGGDYRFINRVALHSFKISFIHPITNKTIDVISDLPEDLKKLKK